MSFHVPEQYRVAGLMTQGNNGAFLYRYKGIQLRIQASDGAGWEHVSVSLPNRCPSWEEMCAVKGLFWDEEDVVIQIHPSKTEWVSYHTYCLHLWKCAYPWFKQEVPHHALVGPKPGQTQQGAIDDLAAWLEERGFDPPKHQP